MRRILGCLLLTVAVVAIAVLGTGAKDDGPAHPRYWAELDNAFGMVTGGDLKVAGVRAGKITELALDRRTKHALVQFEVTEDGFGELRADASCNTRPQSLIGEYFLDCQPGTSSKPLGDGGRIPIAQTSTTVAPDLVNTILRKPYAQRLSIVIDELGAGVAGNEQNLQDAIRRASPALRETDRVLALLGRQNQTLKRLITNADTVVGDLADSREDIARWVDEAEGTARLTATRKAALAEGFRRLPGFLEQLGPTMDLLGQAADAQTPALQDLGAASGQLKTLFERLGPFSQASRPAVAALGDASQVGTKAVAAADPVVAQLRRTVAGAPEAAANLAIVLEHLQDPKNYVEEDPRAAKATGRPMPTGYSGLEGLMSYLYDQALSTNVYDANSHALKVSIIAGGACADYADVKRARDVGAECASGLGPHQPGVNFPDPSDPGAASTQARARTKRAKGTTTAAAGPDAPAAPTRGSGGTAATPAPSSGAAERPGGGASTPPVQVGPVTVPAIPLPGRPGAGGDPGSADDLLDFLLGA